MDSTREYGYMLTKKMWKRYEDDAYFSQRRLGLRDGANMDGTWLDETQQEPTKFLIPEVKKALEYLRVRKHPHLDLFDGILILWCKMPVYYIGQELQKNGSVFVLHADRL